MSSLSASTTLSKTTNYTIPCAGLNYLQVTVFVKIFVLNYCFNVIGCSLTSMVQFDFGCSWQTAGRGSDRKTQTFFLVWKNL